MRKPETTDKKRQLNIREAVDKEATARVHQYIARFWYQAGLSFNLVKLKSFQDMLEAVGAYGRHLKAPSYHAIRVPLLKKELELTEQMLKTNIEEWTTYGCSIMSDGWTDRRQRTIINILVNSPSGTVFLKSIDGSNFVKTGQKLFELLDAMVEKVGVKNVVQVVTDNGSNYVAAGKLLMDKHPNLYWTPCAAHCIDLMLEDIGKLPEIKKTIRRGVSLVGFIYNHTSTLSLLRRFTNKRELVRPAATRFATSFLSLERIHQEKGNIRKMFTSEEWVGNKLSKEAKGREATKTALMPSFWRSVVFTLKVMAPLVRVLRLIDGDKKPAMGYIYEAMDKANETIEKSFNKVETKYKDVFSIIDDRWNCQLHRPLHAAAHFLNPDIFYDNMRCIEFDFEVTKGLYDCIERLVIGKEATETVFSELNIYKLKQGLFGREIAERQRKTIAPAQWWRMYGHSAPNLQQLAIKILGLTCSASGCERNWSVFEQIHSKKRNRLEHQKLNDLVYVKYNQKLRERHEKRSDLDPISLDDIDDCNEWLVGEMDEDNGERGDRVFDDDTLDWDTVIEASGVGEPRTYTRSNKKKRKEPSTSDTRGKAKQNKSLVDEDDDIEEENVHQDDEPSEEEEGEGYASFDDNEEDEDYVEANLDD